MPAPHRMPATHHTPIQHRGIRKWLGLGMGLSAAIAAVAACTPAAKPSSVAPSSAGATCSPTAKGPSTPVASDPASLDGQYIVVLKGGPDPVAKQVDCVKRAPATERAAARGVVVTQEYHFALNGFTAKLDKSQLDAMQQDPDVAYVVADQVTQTDSTQTPAGWDLDRVDQRALPLNSSYTYHHTGRGVTVYVIDTGIRASHNDFGGRVGTGRDFVGDGNGTNDCNGHGTHVAGSVGGATYGVAKQVRLIPVRVIGCGGTGSSSAMIAGIDWVTANRSGRTVANMSLGITGGTNQSLDDAIANAVRSGVVFVVSAGNDSVDACLRSPSRAPTAITVGNTTNTDSRRSTSNYGRCLDLFAPGTSIVSAGISSDTATATLTGTSQAAPHVAGAAALFLEASPAALPAEVRDAIVAQASAGALSDIGTDSPNLLLFSDVTPDFCATGYVWREAFADDHVCVTPATRDQARADNAAAPPRWTTGAFGPDTCITGYVWREAARTDHVCVIPAIRSQASADNSQAAARRAVPPKRCATGYVWREAFTTDYVCVTVARRTQVAADSLASNDRRDPAGAYGITTCRTGYVWRIARESDQVCVTPAERDQIVQDDAHAAEHVAV